MVYFVQAVSDGWTMYRGSGLTRHFSKLSTVKMIADDMGYTLIILNKKGEVCN